MPIYLFLLFVSLCLSIYLWTCIYLSMFLFRYVGLSIYLSVYLPICLFIYIYSFLVVYINLHISTYLATIDFTWQLSTFTQEFFQIIFSGDKTKTAASVWPETCFFLKKLLVFSIEISHVDTARPFSCVFGWGPGSSCKWAEITTTSRVKQPQFPIDFWPFLAHVTSFITIG